MYPKQPLQQLHLLQQMQQMLLQRLLMWLH
jgi:hypothetical protein